MITARTKSVDDTRALAAEVAALARPGDVIVLIGDLGAGKTQFVKGFGAALGITDVITSPTFTLVRHYEGGRLALVHADAYRLDQAEDAVDLALAEYVDDGAVIVVEWGDRIERILPADRLEIRLDIGEAEDERRVVVRGGGARWSARVDALHAALGRWGDAEC
jgi:tRNA threonylcarbamoyladenosine biosynthesis protein TsaE